MKATIIEVINGKEIVTCTKCDVKKAKCEFMEDKRSVYGIMGRCRACVKKYHIEYNKINHEKRKKDYELWKKNNPEYSKRFREKYPEKIKEKYRKDKERRKDYFKEYGRTHKAETDIRSKLHYQKNKERKALLRIENRKNTMPKIRQTMRQYMKKKRETDPIFKLTNALRCRTRSAFKAKRWQKNGATEQLLGAPFNTVKLYIERQFEKEMSWQNYGSGADKWNIDHIIPIASAKTKEELIPLFHYTNLQPLWQVDNFKKGATIPEGYQLKIAI